MPGVFEMEGVGFIRREPRAGLEGDGPGQCLRETASIGSLPGGIRRRWREVSGGRNKNEPSHFVTFWHSR